LLKRAFPNPVPIVRTPPLDIVHVGNLSQTLNHRVVINDDGGLVALDPRQAAGKGRDEIESPLPIARQVLSAFNDGALFVKLALLNLLPLQMANITSLEEFSDRRRVVEQRGPIKLLDRICRIAEPD